MDLFLIRTLQMILSLSLLILIHEFGHFIFSRLFGIRVEKFYLFFNPSFSFFRAKRINGKIKMHWFSRISPAEFEEHPEKTEFGMGWVPLGGYCSISGMIDESLNTEQMAQEPKPWEFRTKPAWQRLFVMVGGVLFNFILALILYSSILHVWGDRYLPLQEVNMGMSFAPVAQEVGFVDGDVLLSADGMRLERFDENTMRLIAEAKSVEVMRGGSIVVLTMPEEFMQKIIAGGQGFAGFRYPTIIKEVNSGSPAAMAGLKEGDHLVAIAGKEVPTFAEFGLRLSEFSDQRVSLAFYRDGVLDSVQVQPTSDGKLGVMVQSITEIYPTKEISYSILASIPAGIKMGLGKLTGYASDMKYAFTKEGAKTLGGFAAIGSLFPPVWSWQIFWQTTAFLSIILAFMNILPIPALDGGHILFLLYEVVSRRKPSDKFMERAQMIGMVLLLGLLIFANGNDLYRWLFK